jgi:beta-lactamase class A
MWTATPVPTAGQVIDSSGKPIAGALVSVAGTPFSPSGTVLTGVDGVYRIGARRWPYQSPTVRVSAPGFLTGSTAGGRLVLRAWPRVTGQVVDDAGNPLPGAVVWLTDAGHVLAAEMANETGQFSFSVPAGLPGPDSLSASADGHDAGAADVTLAVDQAPAVSLVLARQFGTLHIESDPSGQTPSVDGKPATDCLSTPCDLRISVGGHRIAFSGSDYLPWSQDDAVDKDATTSVTAKLDRKTGTLTVSLSVPGDLTIDGQSVTGGPWSGKLATGQHTVSLRSSGAWPFISSATVNWNQTTQVTATTTPVAPGDVGAFMSNLNGYLNAQGGGSYGVYFEQLTSGRTIGNGDTVSLEAASVIKVPEALYLLSREDASQINATDQVDLHPEDFMSGTGSLYFTAKPGDKYSYQQLLALMIQQSDNTAWRALQRVLGASSIDSYAASLGAGDCRQATNTCSARSAGHLLAQLARGRLLSTGSTQTLLSLLETTVFNDRIPYYLGVTTVAHKVGMDPDNGVANDCGVVFQGSDPFVVCVFTTSADPDNGVQVIRDIARAAARLY